MTLEDIWAVYNNAYISYQKGDVGPWSADNAERYSLRKVVEALRDELSKCDWDEGENMIDAMNEILASDGVEATAEDCSVVQYTGGMNDLSVSPVKAAGASARKDEGADGGSVILSDAAERIATPAAAPWAQSDIAKAFEAEMRKAVPYKPGFPAAAPDDVCEWTQEGWEYRKVGCNGYGLHVYSNNYQPKRGRCPYCKWPVRIKSEAAR